MKRSYATVSVEARDTNWIVRLDGKVAVTPKNRELVLPTKSLADAIAAEWVAQKKTIKPLLMPLTRLANTALDRPGKVDVVSLLLSYAQADLLVHRSEEGPLARRQTDAWDPVLEWAERRYNAKFLLTVGIVPVVQPREAVAALRAALERYNGFAVTGLHAATEITASLILSLAMAEKRLSPTEAFALSQVDERYQAERWGVDLAAATRADQMAWELGNAGNFLALACS
jgi:chaperone required for assembly of F1-ATPase